MHHQNKGSNGSTTHIFLDDAALVGRLDEQAARERRSKKAIVVRALERYFESQDEKRLVLEKSRGLA